MEDEGRKSRFKKGNIPWNKGLKGYNNGHPNYNLKGAWNKGLTKDIDERVKRYGVNGSKVKIGKHYSSKTEFKKGMVTWNKGKQTPKDVREKQSKSKIEFYKRHPEAIQSWFENTRKNMPTYNTSIELKIQSFLKQLGIEYFTHQYIKDIEHSYQCDILIPSMNLVIECDGNYWHKYPIGNELDHIRTRELIEKGFKVLRLWEFEIREMDINKFKERLK